MLPMPLPARPPDFRAAATACLRARFSTLKSPVMPQRACWRSLQRVTHGNVWLPSSSQSSAAGLRTSSYYARRQPRTLAATAARAGCTATRIYGSSCAGVSTKGSTHSLRSERTLNAT